MKLKTFVTAASLLLAISPAPAASTDLVMSSTFMVASNLSLTNWMIVMKIGETPVLRRTTLSNLVYSLNLGTSGAGSPTNGFTGTQVTNAITGLTLETVPPWILSSNLTTFGSLSNYVIAYVLSATNGHDTASVTNGLASIEYTAAYVLSATNGHVTAAYVTSAINAATNGHVTAAITNGLATTNYVIAYVTAATNGLTGGGPGGAITNLDQLVLKTNGVSYSQLLNEPIVNDGSALFFWDNMGKIYQVLPDLVFTNQLYGGGFSIGTNVVFSGPITAPNLLTTNDVNAAITSAITAATNGHVTAAVTNGLATTGYVNTAVSPRQYGSLTLSNLAGTGALTNGSAYQPAHVVLSNAVGTGVVTNPVVVLAGSNTQVSISATNGTNFAVVSSSGGVSGGVTTNSTQFGPSIPLTLKSGAVITNAALRGFVSIGDSFDSSAAVRGGLTFEPTFTNIVANSGSINLNDFFFLIQPPVRDGFNIQYPAKIVFIRDGTATPGSAVNCGIVFGTGSGGSGGSERMRIASTGNVGITTNNPSAKLHVRGAGTSAVLIDNGPLAFGLVTSNTVPSTTNAATSWVFSKLVNGVAQVFTRSGDGTEMQQSEHNRQAPAWFYDDADGMPDRVSIEVNPYTSNGVVRFVNHTRSVRLQEMANAAQLQTLGVTNAQTTNAVARFKALPATRRQVVHTETFAVFNARTGEKLVPIDWDVIQASLAFSRAQSWTNSLAAWAASKAAFDAGDTNVVVGAAPVWDSTITNTVPKPSYIQ